MKWFRFYHDAIDDPKVQRLPGDLFKFWVNMLCLASRSSERGVVKLDLPEIAFAMRLDDDEAEAMIGELCRRNLLEEFTEGYAIHNWDSRQFKSDSSAERVAKHRRNAAETADESPAEDDVTADVTLHPDSGNDGVTPKPSVNTDSDTETDTEERQNVKGANAPRRATYPADFEEFWAAFPTGKGNKKKSHDQWKRIKPDSALRDEILVSLESWKACGQWQRGYITHAERWLRDRFWENTPPQDDPPKNITPFQANGQRRPPGQRGYSADELLAMSFEEQMRGNDR